MGAFLEMVVVFCAAHADVIETLGSAVAALIRGHAAHADPSSQQAKDALHAGIAAAAKTAVDAVAARQSVGVVAESAATAAVRAAVPIIETHVQLTGENP